MTYSIEWHPKVRNFLRKLPKNISARIVKKVRQITEKPFHYLEHYEGEDVYKLRIGDYRALIDVDFSNKILYVRVLGYRKNI
jgi:mRNA-degrading endonuclease RelE of RelBE toxin-antitoxin system